MPVQWVTSLLLSCAHTHHRILVELPCCMPLPHLLKVLANGVPKEYRYCQQEKKNIKGIHPAFHS